MIPDYAVSKTLEVIRNSREELVRSIRSCLQRYMTHENCWSNVVCGLWLASDLKASLDGATPILSIKASLDGQSHVGTAYLDKGALLKASPCAQTGYDTSYLVAHPEHWVTVEGLYNPKAGAIIRDNGGVLLVIATEGFERGGQDHTASKEVWKVLVAFFAAATKDERRQAGLPVGDLRLRAYPAGRLDPSPRPLQVKSTATPMGTVKVVSPVGYSAGGQGSETG